MSKGDTFMAGVLAGLIFMFLIFLFAEICSISNTEKRVIAAGAGTYNQKDMQFTFTNSTLEYILRGEK